MSDPMRDVQFRVAAVIFDLDGVLVDSMAAIQAQWIDWGARHDVPREEMLLALHMRGEDLVRRFAPDLDPVEEARSVAAAQAAAEGAVRAFDGGAELLAALPPQRWAVVTSALRVLALGHLASANLPAPPVLVTAEDTPRGKPDPAGYLLAAERLGVRRSDCLVLEDAPAGILAAKSAGMVVIGVASTRDASALTDADVVVARLGDVAMRSVAAGIEVRAHSAGAALDLGRTRSE